MIEWTQPKVEKLISLHGTMSISDIAGVFGVTKASIRGKITRLGISKKDYWSERDVAGLIEIYEQAGEFGVVDLSAYAEKIGRLKSNVCKKAKALGLKTNQKRKIVHKRKDRRKFKGDNAAYLKHLSECTKRYIRENGHPRGMLGKRHTDDFRKNQSRINSERWKSLTQDQKNEQINKMVQSRRINEASSPPKHKRGHWKAGWRKVGGKEHYFRSLWEANYAYYLEWLKNNGEIKEWAYEPETFWFDQIKRGVRSYKPDFRVWENDGSSNLHEVKGWMCPRSKTTLKRMAKYHPSEKIILIDGKVYKSIRKKVMGLVPGWADSERDRRP